jgi:hypothetical protein
MAMNVKLRPVCWTKAAQQSVTKSIKMVVMTLVALKAGAKHPWVSVTIKKYVRTKYMLVQIFSSVKCR